MSENADWVSEVLASQPTPPMPDAVVLQIEQALADEAQRRRQGLTEAAAEQAMTEVRQRTDRGTFGSNAPSHFDKSGLGMGSLGVGSLDVEDEEPTPIG